MLEHEFQQPLQVSFVIGKEVPLTIANSQTLLNISDQDMNEADSDMESMPNDEVTLASGSEELNTSSGEGSKDKVIMVKDSGLSKLEREKVIVFVASSTFAVYQNSPRHRYSNSMIHPEPEGSTQGYPLVSVEVLSSSSYQIKKGMSMLVLKSQDHKMGRLQDDAKRLCLVDDLMKLKITFMSNQR
uniref:Uncharacterized protein n=1 Tax=Tanacetum cinerariifolium TaxID=118510 RepID=A0A699HZM4_TANCI|nr:hypothetical protein [Tanacetum cinerariifolium]